jgi:thymidylate synthase ThyX
VSIPYELKTGIKAKIIAYSQAPNGQLIVTFELEYQRFIHGELMTHRLFSRNAASSRAIPVATIIDQVRNDPAMPIHWGANQAGMQAKQELGFFRKKAAQKLWKIAAKAVCNIAEAMTRIGLHKQVANRILEPFQTMKTVVTATCFENWFWLRDHADAQPEIRALAVAMLEQLDSQDPVQLTADDWHMPYFGEGYWLLNCGIPLDHALAISSSCCAQVSFRKLDDTLEKAQMIYDRLVESEPVHASPFEHQAKPMEAYKYQHGFAYDFEVNAPGFPETWQGGITHSDRDGNLWSGNLKGFIQHRQLIPNNVAPSRKGK